MRAAYFFVFIAQMLAHLSGLELDRKSAALILELIHLGPDGVMFAQFISKDGDSVRVYADCNLVVAIFAAEHRHAVHLILLARLEKIELRLWHRFAFLLLVTIDYFVPQLLARVRDYVERLQLLFELIDWHVLPIIAEFRLRHERAEFRENCMMRCKPANIRAKLCQIISLLKKRTFRCKDRREAGA